VPKYNIYSDSKNQYLTSGDIDVNGLLPLILVSNPNKNIKDPEYVWNIEDYPGDEGFKEIYIIINEKKYSIGANPIDDYNKIPLKLYALSEDIFPGLPFKFINGSFGNQKTITHTVGHEANPLIMDASYPGYDGVCLADTQETWQLVSLL